MKVGEGQKGTSKWWCGEMGGAVRSYSARLWTDSPGGLRAAAPAGGSSEPGGPKRPLVPEPAGGLLEARDRMAWTWCEAIVSALQSVQSSRSLVFLLREEGRGPSPSVLIQINPKPPRACFWCFRDQLFLFSFVCFLCVYVVLI